MDNNLNYDIQTKIVLFEKMQKLSFYIKKAQKLYYYNEIDVAKEIHALYGLNFSVPGYYADYEFLNYK